VLDVLAAAAFVGFAALALAARLARPERRRAAVNRLLAYTVALSFGAGLSQRDAWPFSAWPLAANRLGESVTYDVLVAVDGQGREHDVDYRAWRPLGFDEQLSWVQQEMPGLDPGAHERAAADLLARAERCRQEARRGEGCARERLGPLTAPDFLLHPRLWSGASSVPESPFVALRLYHETLRLAPEGRGGGRTRAWAWEWRAR
jgi:hypothetical protein